MVKIVIDADDEIRKRDARLYESLVHRGDGYLPLLKHACPGPTTLDDISLDASLQPHVGAHIDEHEQVTLGADLLEPEQVNALGDDERPRFDHDLLVGSGVSGEVVHRCRDRLTSANLSEIINEERNLERVGMVEVDRISFRRAERGQVAVIPIDGQMASVVTQVFEELGCQCRFARARPASDRTYACFLTVHLEASSEPRDRQSAQAE